MAFLNKKGDMQYGILVSLIVLLAVLVVFVLFSKFFGEWLGETNQDQICKTSIFAAAQTKKIPTIIGRGEPLISLKCPRKEITIKKSQVVEGGKINQDKAAKIIADEMYKCWDKVGAGKIDPFSQWDVKGESYCLICGYIKFDQALIDFMKENGNDKEAYIYSPIEYLKNRKVPNSGITYYEYFYKQRPPILSNDALAKLGDSGLLPDSLILIQMYKKEEKSHLGTYIIVGAVVAGGIILAIPTGGASLAASLVTAVGFLKIGAIATLISYSATAFAECPDCNALGGVQLVPPTAELNMKVKVDIDGKQKEIPFCTKLVN